MHNHGIIPRVPTSYCYRKKSAWATAILHIAIVALLCSCGSVGDARSMPSSSGSNMSQTTTPSLIVDTPPATTDPTSTASSPVGLVDCEGNFLVRPSSITFACGDGNEVIRNINWTRWDQSEAIGSGTEEGNECVPNCAEGHPVESPASVRLTNPQKIPGKSVNQFLQAVITTPSKGSQVVNLYPMG